MSDLGMGVMINMLMGSNGAEVFKAAVGKKLAELEVDAATNTLRLRFEDGTGIRLSDDGQSCCESRYMTCDDDLSHFVGATLTDGEVRDAPRVEDDCEVHDQQFLVITTSAGSFTVANHNEHNGYYGGFSIVTTAL